MSSYITNNPEAIDGVPRPARERRAAVSGAVYYLEQATPVESTAPAYVELYPGQQMAQYSQEVVESLKTPQAGVVAVESAANNIDEAKAQVQEALRQAEFPPVDMGLHN